MRRPLSTMSSLGALTVTAFLALGSGGLVPALAFDDEPETVIGAFDVKPASPDRREPAKALAAGQSSLEKQYDDALDDLDAGATASAQRLLEQIVARAPESAVAADARRVLGRIYAGEAPDSNGTTAPQRDRPMTKRANWQAVAAPDRGQRTPDNASVAYETELDFQSSAGDRVFFGAGSSEIGARARQVITQQARWLRQNPFVLAVVEGHADDSPLADREQDDLAAARAEAVRHRLIEEGVEPARITSAALGQTEPVATCARPECMAQNRRAVTTLISKRSARHDPSDSARRPESSAWHLR